MNKKIIIPLIGFILLLSYGLSYSQGTLPYPEPQNAKGSPPVCHQAFINEMALMRQGWESNLNDITSQEIPASEMVDDAFEGVRTYRCWMEYLCSTVRYSGTALPAESAGIPLTEDHIGSVPGCADPEDIEIPTTTLHYLEQCYVPEGSLRITAPTDNFDACTRYLELNFGQPKPGTKSSELLQHLKNTSTVYITLEKKLKSIHGDQRVRAMESKLGAILKKMNAMEGAAQTLKTFILKLDDLLPCYASKCS